MREAGLQIFKADNSRIDGWLTVRNCLQPFTDPNTGMVKATLQITESCPNLIRTLPMQQHDKRNPEDLDSKLEDHAPDGLRY